MSQPTSINRTPWQHLYPFQSNYIPINGLNYHFVDQGDGEPVIMLHGNPTWSFYYRSLINALSGRYRTIAPDHMGCGLSDKPRLQQYDYRLQSRINDLTALIEQLGINEKMTLVLHDWGGMIGMAYAVDHPDRIGRLVLLNTAAFLPPSGKSLPLRLQIIRKGTPLAKMAVLGFNLFALSALHMAAYRKLSKAVKCGLVAPYNDWHNRMATLRFVEDIPLEPSDPSYALVRSVASRLHRLMHVPMLICWGLKDFVFDRDYLNEWRRRFPDAEVYAFADAGHYIMEDIPSVINPLINHFLESHPI